MKMLRLTLLFGLVLSSIQPKIQAADTEFFQKSGINKFIGLVIGTGFILSAISPEQSKSVDKVVPADGHYENTRTEQEILHEAEEVLLKYRNATKPVVEAFLSATDDQSRGYALSQLTVNGFLEKCYAAKGNFENVLVLRAGSIEKTIILVKSRIGVLKSKPETNHIEIIKSLENVLGQLASESAKLSQVISQMEKNRRITRLRSELARLSQE